MDEDRQRDRRGRESSERAAPKAQLANNAHTNERAGGWSVGRSEMNRKAYARSGTEGGTLMRTRTEGGGRREGRPCNEVGIEIKDLSESESVEQRTSHSMEVKRSERGLWELVGWSSRFLLPAARRPRCFFDT